MIKVGDIVYLQNKHNFTIDWDNIKPCTITEVGRKYFRIDKEKYIQFDIATGLDKDTKSGTGHNYRVWFSEQDIKDAREMELLQEKIRNKFSGYGSYNLTLDQARRIVSIIEEKNENTVSGNN